MCVQAAQLFELHIYTMGSPMYAMAAMTKDLDGVLGMESSVLIVDDTPGVWPHHSDNLIVLERWVGSYLDCS